MPAEARRTPESNTVVIFCWALQPHRPARNETLPGPDPNSKCSMMLRAQTTRTSPRGLGYSFQTLLSLATEKRKKKKKQKPIYSKHFQPRTSGPAHHLFSRTTASRFRLEQTSRTREAEGGRGEGSGLGAVPQALGGLYSQPNSLEDATH